MDRQYIFRLRGDADQLKESLESAALASDRLADSTEGVLRQQAAARQSGDAFLASLGRQAQAIGRTQTELLALRAAELGVADAARPMIAQIEAATAAQQAEAAATARAAAAQRALEGIRAAAVAEQRQQYQTQQQFIRGLEQEVAALGKTRSELLAARAAKLGLTEQATPLIQRLQAGERAFGGFARGGKISAQEMVQVGYQLNDLAVQVASGSNPLIALVQQGSQLSGTFGGIGNAARALTSLITPTVVAMGGLAAAVGVVGVAYLQGYREQLAFERSLLLTGNRAGVAASQLQALAEQVQGLAGGSIGNAREAIAATVSSGAFGPESLAQAGAAVQRLSELTGRSAKDVVADFARMRDGVARWAADANRSYNFLTGAQFKYIQELERQGKAEEAKNEALRLFNEKHAPRTATELGTIQTLLKGAAEAASAFWNGLLNIGAPVTLAQQLDQAEAELERVMQRLGASPEEIVSGAAVDRAIAEVTRLRVALKAEREKAAKDAATAAENERQIAGQSKEVLDARLSLQRAAQQRSQAQNELARAVELEANDEQFERLQIGYQQYLQRRAALERQGLAARLAAIDAERAIEAQRVVDNPNTAEGQAAQIQQQARLIEIESRRNAVLAERARLERQIRANFGREDISTAGRIRAAQAEAEEEEARANTQRVANARQEQQGLFEATAAINRAMVRDDRQRGLMQIEAERLQLRQRLDLVVLDAEERRAAQDLLAEYVLARQRQLTEELKPEWQRMLEGWQDTQRLMRDASDEFQADFLRTSRSTFVEFFKTGKLNFERLGELAIESVAGNLFDRTFGQVIGGLGTEVADALGLGRGTPRPGEGEATALQQSHNLALADGTLALQGFTAALGGNVRGNDEAQEALLKVTTACTSFGVQLGGLTGALGYAARAALALFSNSGGGGGSLLDSLLGAAAGAIGGLFGGSSVPTGDGSGSTGDFARFDRLQYGGGRAIGGTVGPGYFYDVAERGEPEVYETGGKKYLIPSEPGYVSPLPRLGGSGGPPPRGGNTYITVNNSAEGVTARAESRREGADEFINVIVERAVAEVDNRIAGFGSTGRAIAGRFGANGAANLRR